MFCVPTCQGYRAIHDSAWIFSRALVKPKIFLVQAFNNEFHFNLKIKTNLSISYFIGNTNPCRYKNMQVHRKNQHKETESMKIAYIKSSF